MNTIEEIQEAVRASPRLHVRGAGTKSALSGAATHSVAGLSGMVEYNPSEYTFTAKAGTPVAEINAILANHGQYLPFDPPLAGRGATLGGTIAAGLSGPGRYRFGGVRDFLLGVQLVTGEGRVVRGGGKVVKNAAGFDLPKLMVGSLGRYGILTECTCKVFPRPETTCTIRAEFVSAEAALEKLCALATASFDLLCLDAGPADTLLLRVGGMRESADARVDRLNAFLGASTHVLTDEEDAQAWQSAGEFSWLPKGYGLIKVPINPARILELEDAAGAMNPAPVRHYSVGGNVCWLGWPNDAGAEHADAFLKRLNLPGVAVLGSFRQALLGHQTGDAFARRLLSVLDPEQRFQPYAA